MGVNFYTYMVYGIYFPADDIDYVTFTEQSLPEGLEWMPVGDQTSDKLGTILAVQNSYLGLSKFIGQTYVDTYIYDAWNNLLTEALDKIDCPLPPNYANWHIAGWAG